MENEPARRRRAERAQYTPEQPLSQGSLPNNQYAAAYSVQQPQGAPQPNYYYQQPQGAQQVYPQGYYPQQNMNAPARQGYPPQNGPQVYPPVNQPWQNTGAWQQSGPHSPVPPRNDPPKKPLGKNPVFLAAVIALALAAAVFIGVQAFNSYKAAEAHKALQTAVHAYDTLFCEGVYVDGIHLGGMTQLEAMEAVQRQAQEKRDAWSVTLRYDDEVWTVNAGQLGMRINLADALDAAWAQGRSGTLAERKAQMDELRRQPFHAYTTLPGGDTSVIDDLLASIAASIEQPVQDASIAAFDANLTYPFTFNPEQTGRSVDVESLRTRLYEMVSGMESGTVDIVPEIIYPTVTVEDIKRTQLSVRGEGMTQISTTSTENRTDNIRRAFELISGTVLKPNQVFSFNGVVGKRSTKNGFKTAIEYQNGNEVEAIGGGVCQASTTLYQAAIAAGLEIVKREPHSMQVGYSDFGKDATVYWEYGREIDFQFRNNTSGNLYIKAVVEWSSASNRWVTHVTMYGEPIPTGTRYDFDVQVELLPAPIEPKIVQDKKAQYVTYIDETYETQAAKDGYRVVSYRVTKQNGQEVDREYLDTDLYPAKQQIIYVGVKTP